MNGGIPTSSDQLLNEISSKRTTIFILSIGMFLLAFGLAKALDRNELLKQQAIQLNVARYNPTTGDWEWHTNNVRILKDNNNEQQ